MVVQEAYSPIQMTATANVCAAPAVVGVVICSSSTSGTLTLYDDAATGTTTKVLDTLSLTAGSTYTLKLAMSKGVYAVIGGTASITIGVARMA